jgi:hypothetical protein
MTAPELFPLDEAAARLHVSPEWYKRQLRARKFPGRKIAGRWMLTAEDIAAAVESCAVPAITVQPDPAGLTRTSRRRINQRRAVA